MNLPVISFTPWFVATQSTNLSICSELPSAPFDCQGPNRYRAGIRATAVAHGATGKGNDQCRFELTFSALAPDLRILAPWRDAEFRETFPGRRQMIEYCAKHGIGVEASASKPYSMDRNLWHISYEAGILEDPWFDPTTPDNRDMYKLTVDPELAPDEAQYLELTFERGDCVAIDGESGSPLEIVRKLNVIAGKHGIGRVDLVENRFVGMKSRGVYETPGGTILLHAHRQLETLTMDRDLMHLRDSLIPRYAELIYYGFWYAPEREALQALIDHSQDTVSGVVRLKLYKATSPPWDANPNSPSMISKSLPWMTTKAITNPRTRAVSFDSTPSASRSVLVSKATPPLERFNRSLLFVLDNYDSFTYNLVQYFGELEAEVEVRATMPVWPKNWT